MIYGTYLKDGIATEVIGNQKQKAEERRRGSSALLENLEILHEKESEYSDRLLQSRRKKILREREVNDFISAIVRVLTIMCMFSVGTAFVIADCMNCFSFFDVLTAAICFAITAILYRHKEYFVCR